MSPPYELFHVEYEYFLEYSGHMRMGSVMHIQSFYDTEGILHRKRLMMVNDLSVRVEMHKPPFVQWILFCHFYFIYKDSKAATMIF